MRSNYDNFFTALENTMPYMKVALHGIAGSGKTYTGAKIAGGIHSMIHSKLPIVIFDTETSAKFLRPFFEQHEIKVLHKQSRKLSDLIDTMEFCEAGNAEVLIIDSITHVWEDFLEAYKKKKNRDRIEFQDWGQIKPIWKREFSDRVVMGHYHIVFTGRQGDTYEYVENEDTGKRELVKSGVKMKAETDTAYEPDLLIMMDRIMENNGDGIVTYRLATILKDRSAIIDGKTFKNPSFKDFRPVYDFLVTRVTPEKKTDTGDDANLIRDEERRNNDKREAKMWLERCEAILDKHAGGATKDAKAKRMELTEYAFHGETSETAIAALSKDQLEAAYWLLKEKLEPLPAEDTAKQGELV